MLVYAIVDPHDGFRTLGLYSSQEKAEKALDLMPIHCRVLPWEVE